MISRKKVNHDFGDQHETLVCGVINAVKVLSIDCVSWPRWGYELLRESGLLGTSNSSYVHRPIASNEAVGFEKNLYSDILTNFTC